MYQHAGEMWANMVYGRVGHVRIGICVGHVDFMLFVHIFAAVSAGIWAEEVQQPNITINMQ